MHDNDEQAWLREQAMLEAEREADIEAARDEVRVLQRLEEVYRAMAELALSHGKTGPEVDWVLQQHEQTRDTLELLARYGRGAGNRTRDGRL